MLNYEHPPVGGGGGVFAANLAGEFAHMGHEVDYITTHHDGLPSHEVARGVHVWRERVIGRKDLHTATIISMLCYPWVAYRKAMRLSKERGVTWDVINTHFAVPSGPAGYMLGKRLAIPNVLSVIGGDIYDPSKKYSPHKHPVLFHVVKKCLNQAKFIVPESKDIEEKTGSIYKPKTPILRIPYGFQPPKNGIPARDRAKLGLRDDAIWVASVSRLVRRKAHEDLLNALAQAKKEVPELALCFVGDGPEEEKLRGMSKELGIADDVHFAGFQKEEKYEYLAAADIFALASLHEGFGIVYQEAMYAGLPIITTNHGGQTDYLHEGRNALLCNPRDPDAMAKNFIRLAADANLRKEMSVNNLEDIQEMMIDKVAGMYLDIFKQAEAKCSGGSTV